MLYRGASDHWQQWSLGGLVTATLLTLFILPVVYSWLDGTPETDEEQPGERAGARVEALRA